MKTRKLVRRSLFTAALSTASMMSTFTATAFALDSGAPSSGIQLVQYQPGQQAQNAAQPATSVESELRKMFEESGQPMPSMRPQDLPNANVIPPSQMKPANGAASAQNMAAQNRMTQNTKTQAPASNNSQANAKPAGSNQPKKNFLQKFMGRVSGKDKAAEAAVVPPVPPGYQEPAPAPPVDAPTGVAQNQNGQQMRPNNNGQQMQNGNRMNAQNGMPQNRPGQNNGMQPNGMAQKNMSNGMQPNTGRPMTNGQAMNGNTSQVPNQPQNRSTAQNNAGQRPQQNAAARPGQPKAAGQNPNMSRPGQQGQMQAMQNRPAGKTAAPVSSPGQPVPQVPFRQQNATASNSAAPAAGKNPSNGTSSDAPRYVQPGSAPSFMAGSEMTKAPVQAATSAPPATQVPVTTQTVSKPIVSKTPVEAPVAAAPQDEFEMPFTEVDDANDVLDLDAVNAAVPEAMATVTPEAAPAESIASQSNTTEVDVTPAVRVPELAEPAEPVVVEKPVATVPKAATVLDRELFEEEKAEPAEPVAAEENPFTGVRIDEADTSLNAGLALPPVDSDDNEALFGDPAPPMEEFTENLPAISIPADDSAPVATDANPVTLPPVDVPEVEIPAAELATPVTSSTTEPLQVPATTPSAIDVTEPAPARSVDAERLQQTAEQERLLRQQRQIQARAGQPGFKGFCPVTLRDKRELVDADPSITATFGLQTYVFADAQAKAAFEADPSRYAPAAGGSDIVLLVNSGEEQPGMLDYALWYRDRLYMFRSRETMAAFNQDPQRFANQY